MLKVLRRPDERVNPFTPMTLGILGGGAITAFDQGFHGYTEDGALTAASAFASNRMIVCTRSGTVLVDPPVSLHTYVGVESKIWTSANRAPLRTYLSGCVTLTSVVANAGYFDLDIAPVSDPFEGYERYAVADWDGYGAEPITAEALAAARSFYDMLPSTFGLPDVAPGADGTIGFEWVLTTGPLRKLFIDIGPSTVWSGYWRRADGTKQSIKSSPVNAGTKRTLFAMFDMLNA